jgi:hypothetical protein
MTDRLTRARRYVEAISPAVAGNHGHNATFKVRPRPGPWLRAVGIRGDADNARLQRTVRSAVEAERTRTQAPLRGAMAQTHPPPRPSSWLVLEAEAGVFFTHSTPEGRISPLVLGHERRAARSNYCAPLGERRPQSRQ